MSVGIIKIPVLFDMSGDAVVFGEEVSGDFVTSHLDFLLDMTTEANGISLNAADISSAILIGDQDSGDNIFYSGSSSGNVAVDNLCNRISKAITRGKLVHIPKAGDHSNSGIPMGGRANLTNNLGELGSQYATKYLTSVSPIGDEQMLGQAMARVASIHLVGSPLPAGIFEDQNQIQTDLETASAQTFNSGNTAFYNALAVQLSKVLGGSKSSAPMKPAGDPIIVYSTPGSAAYDINKAITTRLDATAETAFYNDANLIASVKTVSGNANATLQASVQVIAANHPSAESFPRGYFIVANMNSATNNIYEPYWNESTTTTATGMSIGFTYDDGSHFGWAVIQDQTPPKPLDASGTSVPALKSIYEQLMNVPGRSQIMETRDVGGVVDNSNVTLAGGFPFISGDKLVMYLRPKIVFAAQTKAEQSTTLVGFSSGVTLNTPVFNVGRSGQGITGQTYSQSSVYAGQYGADKAFDSTVSGGYGYLGAGNFDNTTGAYNKATPDNTSVDGANLAGEWLQVNVGKKAAVTSYKIYPQNWEKHSIGGRSPHIFKLVYSDDGTNFLTADSQTVGTDNLDTSEWATTNDNAATYIPKTFTLTNTKVGQYWRLIITSLYGNGYSNGGTLSIQELEIMGSDNYSGSGDSGGIDLSGIQTNIVATSENIEDAFPGNATAGPEPEINKWGWMGSTNSDSLTLETTDVTDPRTCDLHIWKITITL